MYIYDIIYTCIDIYMYILPANLLNHLDCWQKPSILRIHQDQVLKTIWEGNVEIWVYD